MISFLTGEILTLDGRERFVSSIWSVLPAAALLSIEVSTSPILLHGQESPNVAKVSERARHRYQGANPIRGASDYSKDSSGVGLLISLDARARSNGWNRDNVGQPIVDSLALLGVKAKYFYRDAHEGARPGIVVFVRGRIYTNTSGVDLFNRRNIYRELLAVRSLHQQLRP